MGFRIMCQGIIVMPARIGVELPSEGQSGRMEWYGLDAFVGTRYTTGQYKGRLIYVRVMGL